MLEVQNLSKKYGKTLAVNKVNFLVQDGEIGILLGPNGAGKSTIIKSIAGLLRYNGAIFIQGFPAREMEAKKSFAYVPELPAMFEALTVREHFEYIIRAYGIEKDEAFMESLMEQYDLKDKQDKMGNELSKGMMQKVSICCALLIRPKVILFDEPMIGLDPKAIKELKNTILKLKENKVSVLLSTHMLEMVRDLWDTIVIMNKGNVVGSYRREDVADKDINELFFEITGGERA